jgi:nucleoid DNA-binding protein
MDKPISMSDKDYLIRVMSIKTNTPVAIIDAIITHQFEAANEALKINNTIELSGFGKFVFKLKKAHKKLERNIGKKEYWEKALEDNTLTEQKRQSYTNKLNNTIKEIEVLKTKLKIE